MRCSGGSALQGVNPNLKKATSNISPNSSVLLIGILQKLAKTSKNIAKTWSLVLRK